MCKNSCRKESCINFSEEGKSREEGHIKFFFSHVTPLAAELCKLFIVVKGLSSIYIFQINKMQQFRSRRTKITDGPGLKTSAECFCMQMCVEDESVEERVISILSLPPTLPR